MINLIDKDWNNDKVSEVIATGIALGIVLLVVISTATIVASIVTFFGLNGVYLSFGILAGVIITLIGIFVLTKKIKHIEL